MATKTNLRSTYKWVEKHITKIGPNTYRIRVSDMDGYATTRDSARLVKRNFLSKRG